MIKHTSVAKKPQQNPTKTQTNDPPMHSLGDEYSLCWAFFFFLYFFNVKSPMSEHQRDLFSCLPRAVEERQGLLVG